MACCLTRDFGYFGKVGNGQDFFCWKLWSLFPNADKSIGGFSYLIWQGPGSCRPAKDKRGPGLENNFSQPCRLQFGQKLRGGLGSSPNPPMKSLASPWENWSKFLNFGEKFENSRVLHSLGAKIQKKEVLKRCLHSNSTFLVSSWWKYFWWVYCTTYLDRSYRLF